MTNGENVKLIEQAEFQGSIRAADETPHETELRKFVRNLTAALKAEIARAEKAAAWSQTLETRGNLAVARAEKAEAERDQWRDLAGRVQDEYEAIIQWLTDFEKARIK